MEYTRITESRKLVFSAVRQALDSHGAEPEPPLTGRALEIGSTYTYLKPLLGDVQEAHEQEDYETLEKKTEELVVESILLLARTMEMTDLYSDTGMETPLTAAGFFALGSYSEQEGNKEDKWRDEDFEDLFSHAKKESTEIKKNIQKNQLDALLHNSVDLVLLVSILLASVIDSKEENTYN